MSRYTLKTFGRRARRWWPIAAAALGVLLAPLQVAAEPAPTDTTAVATTVDTTAEEVDAPDDAALAAGAQVFSQICASCHQAGGVGLSGKYPPLKDNPNVQDAAYIEQVIREGRTGAITVNGETYDQAMPPQAALSDDDIANVIVYVQSGFQAPVAAVVPSAGPIAGTSLPALANMTSVLGLLIAAGVGVLVFAPRFTSAHDGKAMPWLDAWLKAGLIVVGMIVFTVFVPSRVLETETVAKLDRPLQDLIASALWIGSLGGGLWALWYAQREPEDLMVGALSFYDENIPCLAACPVHTNAGMYVAAIADGNDELAYLTARLPNPFASVCGRVCAAPCEDACRRGKIDRPIAIRALKRFVTEQFGPEHGDPSVWNRVVSPPLVERPQSVGIVGGGPAGMACAHDLRRLGYRVTVYEATDKLGGAMWLGIPEYRLDRAVLQADIDAILALGVEVQYEIRLGVDVTLAEMRARHDAVFLGIGATLGRGLDLPGADADGVFKAIEFLINMNRGFNVDVGERVVVIGGGDVAMDAARTALRADDYDDKADHRSTMTEAIDVARMSARAGARHVTVISLESRDEMPAHDFEVEEAQHEGITFVHRRGPAALHVSDGRVTGVETVGVLSVFDDQHRFSPRFDQDDRRVVEADTVILAIGQAIDIESLGSDGPEISPRRTIQIDNDTGRTSAPLVWSGGDAAKGPRTLIDAIADGRRSAADIHRHFTGELPESTPGRLVELQQFHRLSDTYDRDDRVAVPTLATNRRVGLVEVELGFTPEQARCEASRCLRCFANIQLDVQKCVLCALCVDVCPVDVISIVPSAEIGAPPGGSVLLLDEERCIRCALCIERCPPKALSMSVWNGVGVPA